MTAALTGYEIYDPGVSGPWQELTRSAAKAAHARLMAVKPTRLQLLSQSLENNGIGLPQPEIATNQDLDNVERWFLENVEPDPGRRYDLDPVWFSIISDLALYIGDVMIHRGQNLSWGMFTASKESSSYQETVIVGFQDVADPNYFINPGFNLLHVALAKVKGRTVEDHNIVRWVDWAVASDVYPE